MLFKNVPMLLEICANAEIWWDNWAWFEWEFWWEIRKSGNPFFPTIFNPWHPGPYFFPAMPLSVSPAGEKRGPKMIFYDLFFFDFSFCSRGNLGTFWASKSRSSINNKSFFFWLRNRFLIKKRKTKPGKNKTNLEKPTENLEKPWKTMENHGKL